jgi:CRP/FNR family transcriptional regulator, cyclic AMP receptor protein
MIKTDSLRNIYLFKELTNDELAKVGRICEGREVMAGQDVFINGQAAESFFVIQQGTVKIKKSTSKGDDLQLTSLSTGSHFGEMPYLTGESRTATAQATETTSLIEIPYKNLKSVLTEQLVISEKFHRALARFLAQRLKNTTGDLMDSQ